MTCLSQLFLLVFRNSHAEYSFPNSRNCLNFHYLYLFIIYLGTTYIMLYGEHNACSSLLSHYDLQDNFLRFRLFLSKFHTFSLDICTLTTGPIISIRKISIQVLLFISYYYYGYQDRQNDLSGFLRLCIPIIDYCYYR